MSLPEELTDRQLNEIKHFDAVRPLEHVDFEHYSKPQFGPWNPYWYVFDFVRKAYTGRGQRLLSFGCGQGASALRYARLGYEVYGFDISPACISSAQKLAEKYGLSATTHFTAQPAETLTYPDGFFDVVVGENILHHVNISVATAEVLRVLKPKGVAVFKEPMATPLRDRVRRSPLVRWLIPIGVKNVRRGIRYGHPETTVHITSAHIAHLRTLFDDVRVVRFRVLALFTVFTRSRAFLEKCDLALFSVLPFLRRLGDMAVIIVRKTETAA